MGCTQLRYNLGRVGYLVDAVREHLIDALAVRLRELNRQFNGRDSFQYIFSVHRREEGRRGGTSEGTSEGMRDGRREKTSEGTHEGATS